MLSTYKKHPRVQERERQYKPVSFSFSSQGQGLTQGLNDNGHGFGNPWHGHGFLWSWLTLNVKIHSIHLCFSHQNLKGTLFFFFFSLYYEMLIVQCYLCLTYRLPVRLQRSFKWFLQGREDSLPTVYRMWGSLCVSATISTREWERESRNRPDSQIPSLSFMGTRVWRHQRERITNIFFFMWSRRAF